MKKIYSLISICICSGLTFSQLGIFDPSFNEGDYYQTAPYVSSTKITPLTNETALYISNIGFSAPMGSMMGNETALIGKITNSTTSYASAFAIVNPLFSPSEQFSSFSDFEYTSDGKILVAGYKITDENISFLSKIFIGRYNADGTFDATFNSGTFLELDETGSSVSLSINKVRTLSNGKILVLGKRNNGKIIMRLNSDGTIDNTFGTAGEQTLNLMGGNYSSIEDIILLSNGSFLIAGSENDASNFGYQTGFVARMNADGTLDTSFGTNGFTKVLLGDPIKGSQVNSIALTSDNDIICGGWGYWASSNPWDIAKGGIMKLSANGAIDASYAGGQYVQSSDYSIIYKLLVTPNDQLIACGFSTTSNVKEGIFLFMDEQGNLDANIDTDGIVYMPNVSGMPNPEVRDMAIQPDGKLLYMMSMSAGVPNSSSSHIGRILLSDAGASLEEQNMSELSVYPNPAQNQLTISSKESSTVKIQDSKGRIIDIHEVNGSKTIDVSSLPSGMYFIETEGLNPIKFIKN